MPGLYFECYDRDPLIKQEKLNTLNVQLTQAEIEHERRQIELYERRKVAESHLTDEDLYRLREEVNKNNYEKRSQLAQVGEVLKEQHYQKLTKSQIER